MLEIIIPYLFIIFVFLLFLLITLMINYQKRYPGESCSSQAECASGFLCDCGIVINPEMVKKEEEIIEASHPPPPQPKLLDIIKYKQEKVALFDDMKIIVNERHVDHDLSLNQLEVFNDHIYALGNGNLYRLDSETFGNDHWQWTKIDHELSNLIRMRTTLNGENLWLQSYEYGVLLNKNFNKEALVKINGKLRTYGLTPDIYADHDTKLHFATIFPKMKKIENVYDIVLTKAGEHIILNKEDTKAYSALRLVGEEVHSLK